MGIISPRFPHLSWLARIVPAIVTWFVSAPIAILFTPRLAHVLTAWLARFLTAWLARFLAPGVAWLLAARLARLRPTVFTRFITSNVTRLVAPDIPRVIAPNIARLITSDVSRFIASKAPRFLPARAGLAPGLGRRAPFGEFLTASVGRGSILMASAGGLAIAGRVSLDFRVPFGTRFVVRSARIGIRFSVEVRGALLVGVIRSTSPWRFRAGVFPVRNVADLGIRGHLGCPQYWKVLRRNAIVEMGRSGPGPLSGRNSGGFLLGSELRLGQAMPGTKCPPAAGSAARSGT
ncbi:MAG: hypothetical protein JNK85_08275 [Verrucomicrobiales bacterium]|nr:hypothetical protein [Verrucomicrobiales bacterium]